MWPKDYLCDLLDALDVAVCEFDARHDTVRWNSRFLELFPEHAGLIKAGEPYAENLRRFYKVRLSGSDLQDIERYVAEGVERHAQQQQPFEFTHHGRALKVASLPLPGRGRIRVWREVGRSRQQGVQTLPAFDLLDHIPDGACVTDAEGRILVANSEFRRLYDVPANRVIVGTTLEQMLELAWASASNLGGIRARIRAGLAYDGSPFEVELPRNRWRRVVNRHQDDGRSYQVHADITSFKLQQQQLSEARDLLRQKAETLAELARTDSLTGLPNRRQFIDQLTYEIERTGITFLIALDIDRFKSINDRFGHPVGDVCIRKVGRIIDGCAKAAGVTSARTGGEEFAVLGIESLATADAVAASIHEAIASADWSMIHPQLEPVTLSMGIAGGRTIESIQTDADRALYLAKSRGRNRTERIRAQPCAEAAIAQH